MTGPLTLNPITGTNETPKVFAAASGEDTSGIFFGYCAAWNYPLVLRGGWTRMSALINGTLDTLDPPWTRFQVGSFDDAPAGHVYIHGNMSWGLFGGGTTTNAAFMRLANDGGTVLTVRGVAGNALKFSVPDGLGGYTDVATSPANVMPTLGLSAHNVDVKVKNESTLDRFGVTLYPTLISDDLVFTPSGHNTPPTIIFPIVYNFGGDLTSPLPMFYGFGVLMIRNSAHNDGTFEVDQITFATIDNPPFGTIELTSGQSLVSESLTAGVTLLEGPSVSLYLDGALAIRWMDPDTAASDMGTLTSVDLMNCYVNGSISWSEVLVTNCPAFGCGMQVYQVHGRGVWQTWAGTGELNATFPTDALWLSTSEGAAYSEWTFNDTAVGSFRFVVMPDAHDALKIETPTSSAAVTFAVGDGSSLDLPLAANTNAMAAAVAEVINTFSIDFGVRAAAGGNSVGLTAVISGSIGNQITLERIGTHAPTLNDGTLDVVNLHGGADAALPTGGYQVGVLKADIRAKTGTGATNATATIQFQDQPSDGDQIVVNTVTTTFRSSGAVPQLGEINIGANVTLTAANLAAFLNCFIWPQGSNDVAAVAAAAGEVILTALTGGVDENAYVVKTTGAQPVVLGGTINVPGTPELGAAGTFASGTNGPDGADPPHTLTFVNGGTFPNEGDSFTIAVDDRVLTYHEMWGGKTTDKFVSQGGIRVFPGIGWGVVDG